MEASDITEGLERGMAAAEHVLLRVEELQLLVESDRPRRLIDLAQAELAVAVTEAGRLWEAEGRELAEMASGATDPDLQATWEEFRGLLATSSRRASEASCLIASRLLAVQDVLGALCEHQEYRSDGGLHLVQAGEGASRWA